MKSLNQKFMEEISLCRSPELFIGVCRILRVDLLTDQKDEEGHHIPKDFGALFEDVMRAYSTSERKRKRELLSILREANRTKEEDFSVEEQENAGDSENS